MEAPGNLSSKSRAVPTRTRVRLGAPVHGEGHAGKVREGRGLTVADHGVHRGEIDHFAFTCSVQPPRTHTHYTCRRGNSGHMDVNGAVSQLDAFRRKRCAQSRVIIEVSEETDPSQKTPTLSGRPVRSRPVLIVSNVMFNEVEGEEFAIHIDSIISTEDQSESMIQSLSLSFSLPLSLVLSLPLISPQQHKRSTVLRRTSEDRVRVPVGGQGLCENHYVVVNRSRDVKLGEILRCVFDPIRSTSNEQKPGSSKPWVWTQNWLKWFCQNIHV